MSRKVVFLLPLLGSLVAGCEHDASSGNQGDTGLHKLLPSRLPNREAIAKALPEGVLFYTVAQAGDSGRIKITVEDELIRVKARVGEDGKLHDATGRPIAFFHETGC